MLMTRKRSISPARTRTAVAAAIVAAIASTSGCLNSEPATSRQDVAVGTPSAKPGNPAATASAGSAPKAATLFDAIGSSGSQFGPDWVLDPAADPTVRDRPWRH